MCSNVHTVKLIKTNHMKYYLFALAFTFAAYVFLKIRQRRRLIKFRKTLAPGQRIQVKTGSIYRNAVVKTIYPALIFIRIDNGMYTYTDKFNIYPYEY